jgi:hypothetical protein
MAINVDSPLQKPVSLVRILPGAYAFAQFSDGLRVLATGLGLFWSVRWSVIVWHQMTHRGRR